MKSLLKLLWYMEKESTIGNLEVIVGRKLEITPEELEIMAKQLRLAAEERANPGEIVQAKFKGIIFQYNPHLSRGDLERKLSLKIQKLEEQIGNSAEIVSLQENRQC